MAKAELNIEMTVGLTVRPGDTLIVAAPDKAITQDMAQTMKEQLMARLPGLADVVVVYGASVAAYRPDEPSGRDMHLIARRREAAAALREIDRLRAAVAPCTHSRPSECPQPPNAAETGPLRAETGDPGDAAVAARTTNGEPT